MDRARLYSDIHVIIRQHVAEAFGNVA